MTKKVTIKNPTPTSHWLIPHQLLCGGYPHKKYLQEILNCGVNVFICLQSDSEIVKKQVHDYRKDLDESIETYQLPIVDGSITRDRLLFKWCHMILDLLYRGKIIYFHCLGGHGRAGTMATCLLQILDNNLSAKEAIDFNRKMHFTRSLRQDFPTPQTDRQYEQIYRFKKLNPLVLVLGSEKWNDEKVMERELKRFPPNTSFLTTKKITAKSLIYKSKRKVFGSVESEIQLKYLLDDNDIWLVLVFDKHLQDNVLLQKMIKMCEERGLYVRLIID